LGQQAQPVCGPPQLVQVGVDPLVNSGHPLTVRSVVGQSPEPSLSPGHGSQGRG
jgi:hypothetical protein